MSCSFHFDLPKAKVSIVLKNILWFPEVLKSKSELPTSPQFYRVGCSHISKLFYTALSCYLCAPATMAFFQYFKQTKLCFSHRNFSSVGLWVYQAFGMFWSVHGWCYKQFLLNIYPFDHLSKHPVLNICKGLSFVYLFVWSIFIPKWEYKLQE